MAREIVTSENKEEYVKDKLGMSEKKENVKDIASKYKEHGLEADVYDTPHGIELSKIALPKDKRGEGIGSSYMEDLVGHADKHQKRVLLTPDTSFGATSVNRLKDFYKKHGFVENKGKHKDFSTRHSMYREPVKSKTIDK